MWEKLPIVLEATDQQGYGSMGGGGNSAVAQAAMGMPYSPEGNSTYTQVRMEDVGFYEGTEDDHGNFDSFGTWIGMNENEVFAIYSSYGDADFFKICR